MFNLGEECLLVGWKSKFAYRLPSQLSIGNVKNFDLKLWNSKYNDYREKHLKKERSN